MAGLLLIHAQLVIRQEVSGGVVAQAKFSDRLDNSLLDSA